ncbi:GNAT family N-acetyltransferase [Leptospira perolatii]|uniref:GNAT family N-acetyltransferase n=1 Tax=Leptospira perolatii TaxID=2023191 RepID=UPI0013FDDA76|nr:GNAT family N-acetyltransferase [Leptospira perolatii]
MDLEFEQIRNPSDELQEFLWGQLREFSTSKHKDPRLEPFDYISILAKDGDQIVGGLLAIMYFRGMNLQCLWVHEKFRKQGLGKILLRKAEEAAKKFDCTVVYGNTFTFQAPDFYLKEGYKVFGTIEDYPKGYNCYYLVKYI